MNEIDGKNLENELLLYEKMFDGDFYENFMNLINSKNTLKNKLNGFKNRNQCKKTIMYLLFEQFPNYSKKPLEYVIFSQTFPCITKILNTYKNIRKNSVAIILQKIESKLFLDTITKKIGQINTNIPMFTIHDAILTTPEFVELVNEIMVSVITNEIGIVPKISFSDSKTENTEEILEEIANSIILDLKSKASKKSYLNEIDNICVKKLEKFIRNNDLINLFKIIENDPSKNTDSSSIIASFKELFITPFDFLNLDDKKSTSDITVLTEGSILSFEDWIKIN